MKVYAGHIVPLMNDNEERVWVSEAPLDEFRKYLDLLEKQLSNYLAIIKEEVDDIASQAQAAADFIVAFFRLPLTSVALPPRLRGVELPTPNELFWLWVLTRRVPYARRFWKEIKLSDVKLDAFRDLVSKCKAVRFLYEEGGLFRESLRPRSEFKRLSWEMFTKIPADTRPSNNTSMLIPHLLSTAGIASSLYLSGGSVNLLEYAVLRLAALLHDIGKPEAWLRSGREGIVSHPEVSADIARKILSGLDERIVDAVCVLIRYHHSPESVKGSVNIDEEKVDLARLAQIIRDADTASSSVDRLVDICLDDISDVLREPQGKVKDMLKRSGKEVWEYWIKRQESIPEATEKAAKKLFYKGWSWPAPPGSKYDAYLIGVDIRGIQTYIYREDLRTLVGGSLAVDLLTIFVIPRSLVEVLDLQPENLIYAGGGMVFAFSRRLDERKIRELKTEARKVLCNLGLSFVVAQAQLTSDWRSTINELSARLATRKLLYKPTGRPLILLGFDETCESCRRGVVIDREVRICEECKALRSMGKTLFFGSKLEKLREEGLIEQETERILGYVMEWLSGSEAGSPRMGNIAVVKADGNLMGLFMSSAVSPTDAITRSIRVDYALKRGLTEVYEELGRLSGDEDSARLFVGTLYAGGDDLMAIWPSYLTVPAVLILSYWFWREMGGTRQLSVGMAGGKSRHNVWALAATAEELLTTCKRELRRCMESMGMKSLEGVDRFMINVSCIVSFLLSDSQMTLPSWVDDLKDNPFTSQPLALYKASRIEGLGDGWLLLSAFSTVEGDRLIERVEGIVEKLAGRDCKERAKAVRNTSRDIYKVSLSVVGGKTDNLPLVMAAYSLNRYVEKAKNKRELGAEELTYLVAAKACKESSFRKPAPLYDLFLLAKFVLGGRS